MKKVKRWLALILAITLVGSNAIYQLGTSIRANETENVGISEPEESAPEEQQIEDTQEPVVAEDNGFKVQVVEPEEKNEAAAKTDGQVEEAGKVQTADSAEMDSTKTEVQAEEAVKEKKKIKLNTAVDNSEVVVDADSESLPEGATIVAKKVNNKKIKELLEDTLKTEGTALTSYSAYDITILDEKGKKIQPKKLVNVTINGVGEEKGSVYYIDDAKSTASKVSSKVEEGTASFETDHFSTWASVQAADSGSILGAGDVMTTKPENVTTIKLSGVSTNGQITITEGYLKSDGTLYIRIVSKNTSNLKDIEAFYVGSVLVGGISTTQWNYGNTIYINVGNQFNSLINGGLDIKSTTSSGGFDIKGDRILVSDITVVYLDLVTGVQIKEPYQQQIPQGSYDVSGKIDSSILYNQKEYKHDHTEGNVIGTTDKPIVIQAYYKTHYTVTYNDGVDGVEVFPDKKFGEGDAKLWYGDPTPSFGQDPTRPGYTFAGWNPAVADKVTGDATYVAQWSRGTYTVTYADGVVGEEVFADDLHIGLEYGTTTPGFVGGEPSRDGYIFTGWSPNVAGTVTGNATYEAQWARDVAQFGVEGYEGFYDGQAHAVTKTGTLKVGEKWQYSTDGINWQDAEITRSDAGTTNVHVRVVNVSGIVWPGASADVVVKPRTVTLTSATESKTYDGTPLTNHTVTSTAFDAILSTGFVAGEGAEYDVTGSQTYVGSSANAFTYELKENTKEDNYIINKVEGTLTVTQITTVLNIEAKSAEKVYDGTALTKDEFTYTSGVLVDGDRLEVTVSGSQTNAGSSANNITECKIMRGEGEDAVDVTANYTIGTKTAGTLTVTRRPVTMESATDSKPYDGTALTNKKVDDTGFVEGEGVTYAVSGSQTDVGSSANTFTYTANEGTDLDNYTITETEGTLTVTKSENQIVIVAANGSKVYDGTPLTNAGYTYTQGVLAEGDELEVTVSGSQTDAGESANVVTSYKVMRGETDVTSYYTFGESVNGTLSVTKRPVTMTSGTSSKEYDGTPLTKPEVTDEGFVTGEGATYTVSGSQTVVGTSDNTFTYAAKAGTNLDNYEITKTEGTLTVTKNTREIVITADSSSKVYDGTPLTDNGYTYTENVLVEGDVLTAVVEGSKTNVGTADNVVTNYVVKRGTVDVTNNYTFGESVDGTLTVTKRPVTITSHGGTKVYDGIPLTNNTVTAAGFVGTDDATYTVTGSQTDVGKSNNTFTYELNDGTEADNYEITTVEGELEVTKVTTPIVITAASDSKVYDGSALTNGGYTITSGTLANGDVLTVVVTGSQTNAGSSANVVTSYEVKRGDTDVTGNYTFGEFVDGTLTVTPKTVTLTSETQSKTYDGTALTNHNVTAVGFVGNDGASYDVTGSQTDVGTSDNVFTYELNAGTLAGNYTITQVVGKLTVNPIGTQIVITADSSSKVYDGSALTDNGYTYTQNVLAAGDVLTATVTGSQTDAGSSANEVIGYKVMRGAVDVTDNYTFGTSVDGTLTVNKKDVTLTSATDSKVYDGDALTNHNVTAVGFAAGEGATYDVTGSQLDVGTSDNAFTYKLNTNTKASNYNIKTVNGTLTVTPITDRIVITADSSSRKYDGTPLIDAGYTYTQNVLVAGDVLTAVVTGSQTNTGKSANVVTSYQVMRGEGEDAVNVTGNYTFAPSVNGTLTVTPREVTLKSENAEKVYDGTPLTNSTVTVTGEGFADGEGASYNVTGSQLDAGNSKNTFTYTLNAGTKASNYDITSVEGTLVVKEIASEIIITAASNSKVYDGSALTDAGVTYTEGILKNGDKLTAVVEGSQKEAGSSANVVTSYKVMRGDKDVTKNYKFGDTVDGTLTVTKRPVTLTSKDAEKVYDGTPLTNSTVTVTGEGFADGEGASYNVTGSQTEANSSKNTFTYKLNEGTEAENYTIETVEGDLIVTKRTITIKANDKTAKYTGNSITESGSEITSGELAEGQKYEAVVEGSQTLVGSSDNTITSVVIKTEDGKKGVTVNYIITVEKGTLTVTGDDVDDKKVISKTHEDKKYNLGETITFTIKVKNIYAEAKTITITEQEGVTITGNAVFENVPAGTEVSTTAGYKVTEKDILAGSFTNIATAVFSTGESYEATDDVAFTGVPTVPTPPVVPPVPTNPDGTVPPTRVMRETPTTTVEAGIEIREVFRDEDGVVPLGYQDLEHEHKCCILHFLFMLLALIVLTLYTRNMKKHQENIFEMREELEKERKKRGLSESQKRE